MEDKTIERLGKVGLVGRFKPFHLGAYRLLEAACKQADHVVIGIGSSNKYNLRNPFTAEESEAMIRAALDFDNYEIIHVPDSGHILEYSDGKKWKQVIKEKFGKLDYFVSGNDYVRSLLEDEYSLLEPWEIVPEENRIKLRASRVRLEMAKFGRWEELVPKPVDKYLSDNGVVDRFRREFGLQTLADLAEVNLDDDETLCEEKLHTGEV